MKNERHNLSRQRGMTLTEILIVLIIIAVVASLAFMQMGAADTRFKRQNVSRELKVAFERARFDSVKRHAENPFGPAIVTVDTNSYTLKTDLNQNGTFDSGESVVTALPSDVTISPYVAAGDPNFSLPLVVTFDKRGEVTAPGGAKPRFYVCNINCSSPDSSNADLVIVTPTGTVNLLGGGSSPPTFGSANVSTVSTTANISTIVSVP